VDLEQVRHATPLDAAQQHENEDDGSELARAFFTFAALVGAAMCSAFRCGSHDRAPVQFRTWSPILSSCTTPHESTLSPQARRNLPSARRNPLERRRSAIPARGPLEFLDCRRRPQAHQGLADGAVDVTGAGVRVSAQESRVTRSVTTGRPLGISQVSVRSLCT
jgi:hypothetical protein